MSPRGRTAGGRGTGRRPPGSGSARGAGGVTRLLIALLGLLVAALLASTAWRWWGPRGGVAGHREAPETRHNLEAPDAAETGPGERASAGAGPGEPASRAGRAPPSVPAAPSKSKRERAFPTRIEVLNGSGEPGAAAKLASYLREGGFSVVHVGSADRYDYVRTLVVGRTEDARGPASVAGYLGDVSVIRQRAPSEADVTVVVGRDRGRLPWGEGQKPKSGR